MTTHQIATERYRPVSGELVARAPDDAVDVVLRKSDAFAQEANEAAQTYRAQQQQWSTMGQTFCSGVSSVLASIYGVGGYF
ncbi:MAG: hypothetical protein KGL39_32485 [Patescibacteria group bacterium]|nr:hypothetical protein [Patescibacteria group bacterium]